MARHSANGSIFFTIWSKVASLFRSCSLCLRTTRENSKIAPERRGFTLMRFNRSRRIRKGAGIVKRTPLSKMVSAAFNSISPDYITVPIGCGNQCLKFEREFAHATIPQTQVGIYIPFGVGDDDGSATF